MKRLQLYMGDCLGTMKNAWAQLDLVKPNQGHCTRMRSHLTQLSATRNSNLKIGLHNYCTKLKFKRSWLYGESLQWNIRITLTLQKAKNKLFRLNFPGQITILNTLFLLHSPAFWYVPYTIFSPNKNRWISAITLKVSL